MGGSNGSGGRITITGGTVVVVGGRVVVVGRPTLSRPVSALLADPLLPDLAPIPAAGRTLRAASRSTSDRFRQVPG